MVKPLKLLLFLLCLDLKNIIVNLNSSNFEVSKQKLFDNAKNKFYIMRFITSLKIDQGRLNWKKELKILSRILGEQVPIPLDTFRINGINREPIRDTTQNFERINSKIVNKDVSFADAIKTRPFPEKQESYGREALKVSERPHNTDKVNHVDRNGNYSDKYDNVYFDTDTFDESFEYSSDIVSELFENKSDKEELPRKLNSPNVKSLNSSLSQMNLNNLEPLEGGWKEAIQKSV